MGKHRLTLPASLLAGRSALDAESIKQLRRDLFPEGIGNERDVESLLAMFKLHPGPCAGWHDYVIEAVTAFVIDICHPYGAVDETNARWLTGLVASNGAIHSVIELEIVLHVLEKARQAPDSLATLALDQLRLAVCEDRGAYRHKRADPSAGVTLEDLSYIYRILRGSVARGRVLLPKEQLECLTRIEAESPPGRPHHPGWHDLLAAIAPAAEREERRRPVRWLNVADAVLLEPSVAA
ncbi:hypothetical protein M8R20_12550 [Pseudomonas sp. R2.Fl]|nr:hypothetical protein [Pseudomonas sp. R2.Fl]